MATWDLAPSRDPDSGLPYSFIEMPLHSHLGLWSAGPRQLLSQSRYCTLLVSIHGMRLYERRDLDALGPEEADAVRSFLVAQRSFQRDLLASLRSDPLTAAIATPELVARNSQLIWTWDYLSLVICLNWAPRVARAVPTAQQPVDMGIAATESGQLTLEPWPFEMPRIRLRCEGRRVEERAETDQQLVDVLGRAPWETVEFELVPS